MPKQAYRIEFGNGGPLDGYSRLFFALPAHGDELTHEGHSYCFDVHQWMFTYRGRWRNITLGTSLLTYRTLDEALRQLDQLQLAGAITADKSLEIQARIKGTLQASGLDPAD